jgi:hypothetical protein
MMLFRAQLKQFSRLTAEFSDHCLGASVLGRPVLAAEARFEGECVFDTKPHS